MALIVSDLEVQAVADDRTTNLNAASNLRLFKVNVVIDPSTVLGDLTEADFSGYAAILALAWDLAAKDVDGSWFTKLTAAGLFTHNGGAVVNTIYGMYVDDGAALLLAANFGQSILMENGSLPFTVQPTFTFKDSTVAV